MNIIYVNTRKNNGEIMEQLFKILIGNRVYKTLMLKSQLIVDDKNINEMLLACKSKLEQQGYHLTKRDFSKVKQLQKYKEQPIFVYKLTKKEKKQ